MANEFIARNGLIAQNNSTITGSLTVSGSSTLGGDTTITGSLNVTGSSILGGNTTITGSLNITGSITSTGTLTAQTLVVQTVSSSIVYSSGSNIFGNALTNTQTFTGSVNMTGSLSVNGATAINGTLDVTGSITSTSDGIFSGVVQVPSSGNGGYFRMNYSSNGASRSWRINNDAYNNGDFAIAQSTTQTGTSFANKFIISAFGDVTIGSVPSTGTGALYANKGTFSTSIAVGAITPSATVGRIDASNDIVAFSTSDERLKENIVPIADALDKINKIGGYTFSWKSEEDLVRLHGFTGNDVGVIAQQVAEILPEVVTVRDSGYMAVKYEKLIPLLIEGIKAQQIEINELKELIKNKL